MEAASDSISNFKCFVEALNKFLEANGLGSAEYSADYSAVSFRADEHCYDIAMFRCGGNSNSFIAGCEEYQNQENAYQYCLSRNKQ